MRSVVSRLRASWHLGHIVVLVLVLGGVLAGALVLLDRQLEASSAPEQVVRQYLATLYARDFERAYQLISSADKAYKTQADYLRENNSFTGFALEASRQLASYIEYSTFEIDKQGEGLIVTAQFTVPDGNAPAIQEILLQGDKLTQAESMALLEEMDRLYRSGQIPTFEGEESFELVQEPAGWRIVEHWAEAVRIHFSGAVKAGLAWEFKPLQEVVLAKPGETLQASYWAKNLSDEPLVAKARHIDRPEEFLNFFTIIQCFCFVQQTLQPGEEINLPLAFRVEWDTPSEVKDFYVYYEFYPLEAFPEE